MMRIVTKEFSSPHDVAPRQIADQLELWISDQQYVLDIYLMTPAKEWPNLPVLNPHHWDLLPPVRILELLLEI